MKTSWIVKVNFLVVAFGLTAFLIYSLNHKGLSREVLSVFGLSHSGSSDGVFKVKWCDTRVVGLILPDEFKISQHGRKWVYEAGAMVHEMNFLAVERWLAQNCTVEAHRATPSEAVEFNTAILIKFVNGQVAVLKKNKDDIFLWNDEIFSSPQLDSAISGLKELMER